MSDNLKVAKECGIESGTACTKDGQVCFYATKQQLEAYTSRILASQQAAHDAEIARLKEEMVKLHNAHVDLERSYIERLSAATAACAMKDEAFKEAIDMFKHCLASENELPTAEWWAKMDYAISATPQQVSVWEAKKQAQWNEESNSLIGQQDIEIETLLAQVASLRNLLNKLEYNEFGAKRYPCEEDVDAALNNTQATAEQYERDIVANALDYVTNRMEKKLSKAGTFSSGMHSTSQVLLLLNEAEAELFSDAHTTLKKAG